MAAVDPLGVETAVCFRNDMVIKHRQSMAEELTIETQQAPYAFGSLNRRRESRRVSLLFFLLDVVHDTVWCRLLFFLLLCLAQAGLQYQGNGHSETMSETNIFFSNACLESKVLHNHFTHVQCRMVTAPDKGRHLLWIWRGWLLTWVGRGKLQSYYGCFFFSIFCFLCRLDAWLSFLLPFLLPAKQRQMLWSPAMSRTQYRDELMSFSLICFFTFFFSVDHILICNTI